jgi:hypothetical protein
MPAPVITPSGPLTKRGKDVQHFSANQSVTWTKSGGTFSGTTGTAVDWTAPNISGSYTVTATNGSSDSTTVTITVTAVVPFGPDRDFEPVDGKKVLLFEAEDGSRQTTVKGRKDTFPFIRNTAKKSEHDEMKQFWNDNYPGKQVYFTVPGDSEALWWIDSDFKRKGRLTNLWGYSFDLKKVQ